VSVCEDIGDVQSWSSGGWSASGPLLVTTQLPGVKVRYETDSELPTCCQVSSLNENKAKSLSRKYPSGVIKYPFLCNGLQWRILAVKFCQTGGTAAAAPPLFRPIDPSLCGSHPLVIPY